MPTPTSNSIPVLKLPDGHWTCRWINDLLYQRVTTGNGISVVAQVVYVNHVGTTATVYAAVESLCLCTAVPGYQFTVNQQRVHELPVSNARQERAVYHVQVSGKALVASSQQIIHHLPSELPQDTGALARLARQLGLPTDFAYSHAHLVPNTDASIPVDYFLVPSYEVVRYFFLMGSELSRHLLSYFTSPRERASQELDGFFAHPAGTPLILQQNATRLAVLLVKEGLSGAEINCLARLAFLKQATACLDRVKYSLLLKGWGDKKYAYRKLQTVFPQDMPFTLAACGTRFSWQGRTYVLVDQIYDVQEELPFDQVLYLPLVDHSSQTHVPNAVENMKQVSARPKSQPAPSHELTTETQGDQNQPADLTTVIETGFSFANALKPPLKLEKVGQVNRYQTTGVNPIMQEVISLQAPGQWQAHAGRGKAHRRDTPHYAPTAVESGRLFRALSQQEEYQRLYFNLAGTLPCFVQQHYVNLHTVTHPFDVLICRLEYTHSTQTGSIYFAWANTLRYALFHAPSLQPIPEAVLSKLCTEQFSKYGLPLTLNEAHIDYQRRNPGNKDVPELAKSIGNYLQVIVDAHLPRLR